MKVVGIQTGSAVGLTLTSIASGGTWLTVIEGRVGGIVIVITRATHTIGVTANTNPALLANDASRIISQVIVG